MLGQLSAYCRAIVKHPLFLAYSGVLFLFALLLGTVLALRGTNLDLPGPNSSSYSYLGHRAFVELLEEVGPKPKVRYHYSYIPPKSTVLYLAPKVNFLSDKVSFSQADWFREIVFFLKYRGGTVLLALPKWHWYPQIKNPYWIQRRYTIRQDFLERLLHSLCQELGFAPKEKSWQLEILKGRGSLKVSFEGQSYSLQGSSILLFRRYPSYGVPLVETSAGLPLAVGFSLTSEEGQESRLILLSDSDVFSNGELGRGDNADFAVAFVRKIHAQRSSSPLFLDETCHQTLQETSFLRWLFRNEQTFYLALHLILLGLLWAGRRALVFAPQYVSLSEARSRKEQVETMGALTFQARDHRFALHQYIVFFVRQYSSQYPWLEDLPFSKQVDWLIEREKARRLPAPHLETLLKKARRATKQEEINQLLIQLKQWKENFDASA